MTATCSACEGVFSDKHAFNRHLFEVDGVCPTLFEGKMADLHAKILRSEGALAVQRSLLTFRRIWRDGARRGVHPDAPQKLAIFTRMASRAGALP